MAEEKIQRLSEGYDFIEESSAFSDEALSFQDASELVISESESEKSPYKILGKARGCFAPIGEFSRNKRLYSNDLWPTVLANEEFSNRLNSRSIFGCISHSDKKVDDVDIREGKVSHIVSKLEIREDDNKKPYLYGELEILDTPAGRILEAMYKGGANLYVSSRGAGKLIPVPGQNYSMVRPDSYFVECFDVVCRPGFLKAKPVYEGIKESEEVKVEEALPIQENVKESSEIDELKSQLSKLTKIIEKVVDDVYETEEASQEQPTNEDKQEQSKKALAEAVDILLASNLQKSVLKEVLEELIEAKKQIQQ